MGTICTTGAPSLQQEEDPARRHSRAVNPRDSIFSRGIQTPSASPMANDPDPGSPIASSRSSHVPSSPVASSSSSHLSRPDSESKTGIRGEGMVTIRVSPARTPAPTTASAVKRYETRSFEWKADTPTADP